MFTVNKQREDGKVREVKKIKNPFETEILGEEEGKDRCKWKWKERRAG